MSLASDWERAVCTGGRCGSPWFTEGKGQLRGLKSSEAAEPPVEATCEEKVYYAQSMPTSRNCKAVESNTGAWKDISNHRDTG